jgi:hypothetical protein
VAAKRLVLDANTLARAVLGVRVRGLIEHYAGDVAFFVPESAIAEAQEHLPTMKADVRLHESVLRKPTFNSNGG